MTKFRSRPIAVDLFCGAGGASMGLHRAGFEVIGVDVKPQPRYPFRFIQADALQFDFAKHRPVFVWASPPCQKFSPLAFRWDNHDEHPDYIDPIRQRLKAWARSGGLYAIENVEGAPLNISLRLCGTMFPGLKVIRHRIFETNFILGAPGPHGYHPLVDIYDRRTHHYHDKKPPDLFNAFPGRKHVMFTTVTGHTSSLKLSSEAMGIDWMTKKELNEAIPPAYSQHIGAAALARLRKKKRVG